MKKGTLIWDVTDRCNLRCTHCYNADKYFRRIGCPPDSRALTSEEAFSVVDCAADADFEQIHMLGGEPFYRSDILEIIEKAQKKGLRVTINTNGTLLNTELSKKIIHLGVDQITISLDGTDEATNDLIRGEGTFKKVTKNIRELSGQVQRSGSNLMVQLAFVMTKNNLESIPKIPALAADMGVRLVDMMWLYENGNACQHLDELQPGFERPQEYLEKALLEKWRHYPQVALQLDTRPRLAAYLSRKYGFRVL